MHIKQQSCTTDKSGDFCSRFANIQKYDTRLHLSIESVTYFQQLRGKTGYYQCSCFEITFGTNPT